MPLPQAQAVLACGREGMLLGDSHMMLFLSFRRVVGSSLGVCGVPRVVEALVESLSKASTSGDWGELSMRLATSALWYCCRVTWAHRHACQAQQGPRPTGTSWGLGGTKPPDSGSVGLPRTHQAPRTQQGERVPGQVVAGMGWSLPAHQYLDKLHITEDVHGVVRCVDIVAAAVELCGAAPVVVVFPAGGLRAVEPTAPRW